MSMNAAFFIVFMRSWLCTKGSLQTHVEPDVQTSLRETANQEKVDLKVIKEGSWKSFFQTADELRGCTKVQCCINQDYCPCESCKDTLVK